ncbi:glycosyltransferase family 4 protein [Rhizobium sp. R693]|uniref:glycosyltransferase family 4 protein n=1 Tax=Rhizobium sp. R693 TaxID=1764276 RepID=UPI000B5307E3|nr:glycosyltransferase family 4 protein [Rhizobium sp. R693]OWV84496.1 glycosyl transferase [Rhizobium sp. R693]
MRFAYFALPHIGGTYTVFKQLRHGLAGFGIDVCWLAQSNGQQTLTSDLRDEMAFGTLLNMPDTLDERTRARCLAAAIESRGYDGVFINVLGDRMEMNIARYLREDILRVMIVHNITPGTYAAATSIRNYVHATVGVSERCRSDLIARHGFSPKSTFTIPNALDRSKFARVKSKLSAQSPLRLLFLGRIEDASKGVLWLPSILQGLPNTVTLTIAGDGPDLAKLKARFSTAHNARVFYEGAVSPHKVPELAAHHDVLIMPSRFEGFGMTIIEAMAAGCVPVVSNIRGVTDTIVDDGQDGLLFPVGSYGQAIRLIAALERDRSVLARMSAAASRKVAERFSSDEMARRYYEVIGSIRADNLSLSPPLDLDGWSLPPGMRPGLRTYIPGPLKNWLRVMRERL